MSRIWSNLFGEPTHPASGAGGPAARVRLMTHPVASRRQMRSAVRVTVIGLWGLVACAGPEIPSQVRTVDRPPALSPDYVDLIIPPNIAPLNFHIREAGTEFVVRYTDAHGREVRQRCPNGDCRMNVGAWRRLLARSRGGVLLVDVYAHEGDLGWVRFRRITHKVAVDSIDAYIVYRLLTPNRQVATIKGVYQRSLEGFARQRLISERDGTFQCFNCHTFYRHDPSRFFFHVRGAHAGTVFINHGKTRKVDTRAGTMYRPIAYAAWHPDGRHIAGTLNEFAGCFPATERRYFSHTVEKRGDLVVYDLDANRITTDASVFGDDFVETHPCWSPDGYWIYFVRSREQALITHCDLDSFRADLMRIHCDVERNQWGPPETVLACAAQGRSAAFPRPSPDGRFLAFILSSRGTYPITEPSSQLCLMNLGTGAWVPADSANSAFSESYPRWSANGRWMSFLSNRGDARSALPYFAYVDRCGTVHRPFVLPQHDPSWFTEFTDSYNTVELVRGRVPLSEYALFRAMRKDAVPASIQGAPQVDAVTQATIRRRSERRAMDEGDRQGHPSGNPGVAKIRNRRH